MTLFAAEELLPILIGKSKTKLSKINLTQHILFKQFKCVNGLELTNLPLNQFSSMQENFVQILRVFENLWIITYVLKDLIEIRVYELE